MHEGMDGWIYGWMDGWMDKGGGGHSRQRSGMGDNEGMQRMHGRKEEVTVVVAWTGGGAHHTGRYWG